MFCFWKKDIFVGEEFLPQDAHILKTFNDIGEVDEFWMVKKYIFHHIIHIYFIKSLNSG
jgi:hypothetical protein